MDWSSLFQGLVQGLIGGMDKARGRGKGLYDRLRGGASPQPSSRGRDSENMDEPALSRYGSAYPEGEEAPIPRIPTRPTGDLGGMLGAGGFSSPDEVALIREKERILRQLLRGGDLQHGPMR